MDKLKKNIILIACAVVGLLHLYSFVSEINFYPVVQYNMFSILKKVPAYKGPHLYAIDSQGKERPFKSRGFFFFSPYNQRGFYRAFKASVVDNNYQEALQSLVVKANKIDPKISGLRLYDIVCSCGDFVKAEIPNVEAYIKYHCKRSLQGEARLE
ncbi:hypothetical protein K2P97_07040 [bacterium]|nr:hypothetical protein [bacterium]